MCFNRSVVKTGGIMAKLIINLILAIILIVIVIIQPSYTNDQTHSLIDPGEPVFSSKEILTMRITGVVGVLFMLLLLFQL